MISVLTGTKGGPLNPDTVAIYLDGKLAAGTEHMRTAEAAAAMAWNPGSLYPNDACYLGFESHQGEPNHQSMPFVGALDELLVFSRALSDREIQAFSR